MMTNLSLTKFALNQLGSPYVMGTNGLVLTRDKLEQLISWNPAGWFTQAHIKKCYSDIGKHTTDCHGLIEWFFRSETGNPYDTTADLSYKKSTIKGNISTLPDIPGICLHKSGHVGVYIGSFGGIKYAVEARGADFGVCVTNVDGRGWEHWYRHDMMHYSDNGWIVPNVIKKESEKCYIVWLQCQLNRQIKIKNIPDQELVVDGAWGAKTAKAVKSFWLYKGWDKTARTSSGYGIGKTTIKALQE